MARYKLTMNLDDREYPVQLRLSSKDEVIDTLLEWMVLDGITLVSYEVV